jgi:hypothetical protein
MRVVLSCNLLDLSFIKLDISPLSKAKQAPFSEFSDRVEVILNARQAGLG